MPWDSFRKKRLSASSPAAKKKDQSRQPDHNQQTPVAAAAVAAVNNKDPRNHHPPPSSSSNNRPPNAPKTQGLPQEIYQKIKEVDQEPSTLTAAGVEGLSARVQEKYEFTQPTSDGASQTYICQTVELIKRPGQSLGLYLREGNGGDRFDGVFVSRLADGFDLQKSGVLNTGDEILTVNDVDVTRTSIDEVVVMISIPRRLVLRTRTIKGHHGGMLAADGSINDSTNNKSISDSGSVSANKPIAVLKQLPREESRESSLTDDGTPLVCSQLIATAQTSFGVKARQQESAAALAGDPVLVSASTGMPLVPNHNPIHSQRPPPPPRHQYQHLPPQRSLSDRWSYNRQLAMHTPRVLDAEGRQLNDVCAEMADLQGECNNGSNTLGDVWRDGLGVNHVDGRGLSAPPSSINVAGCLTNNNQGIYLRTQRLQSHFQTLERAAATPFNAASSSFTAFPSGGPGASWNHGFVPEPAESVPQRSMSGYGVSNPAPRSVLRQPTSAFRTGTSTENTTALTNIKSNSLPRRQPGRTIKWRTDLPSTTGGDGSAAMNPATAALCYSSDMSDSDGAVSAPEFPMSPANRGVPQPVYPLPRTSASGKTVDDIFSRAEYQAWTRSVAQNGGFNRSNALGHPHEGFSNPYGQIGTHQRFTSDHNHRPRQRHDFIGQSINSDQTQNVYYSNAKDIPVTRSSQMHWNNQNSSIVDDDDSSSSSIVYGNRPVPPPRSNRQTKTRSSSLPPKGVLNRAIASRPVNGGGVYESTNNTGTNGQQAANVAGNGGSGAGYALDVSPLPHRRLPLALAAASPGFGYTADGPTETLASLSSTDGGNSTIAALTGILTVRIIEGRGLRSRDPEELYCVLEVDGEHRARTEVSDWHAGFRWEETFEMDVWDCRQTDFYVYSWHTQYRHKLRHHASLQLVDALLNMTKFDLNDDSSPSPQQKQPSNHSFALTLDPRGQLFIQIGFRPMSSAYRRTMANRRASYWGMSLQTLVEREGSGVVQVPVAMRRLIQEVERRGVDTGGLYVLCGSSEKKRTLKEALERDPSMADISADSVPDLNILTSVLKDFLRELPESLVPHSTFQMLLEAWKVCVANEKEGNARLMLGVIDCLPKTNKCTFMVLMDHFKHVISQSQHNGLSATKCSTIFGPLIFCTSQAFPISAASGSNGSAFGPLKSYFSFLDHRLAARLLEVILDLWPSAKTTLESSSENNSTINLTNNGNRSLVELSQGGSRLQESNC